MIYYSTVVAAVSVVDISSVGEIGTVAVAVAVTVTALIVMLKETRIKLN